MKSINLFSFTRIPTEYASEYLNMLSDREQKMKVKPHEFETVKQLVSALDIQAVSLSCLDGFFFAYSIHQIGKEFDLLKIEKDKLVLNIELKCEPISEADIEKQLRQNHYYLEFIAPEIRLFTFVGSTGELYRLDGDDFRISSLAELSEAMTDFGEYMTADIDQLFEPKHFLISPFTDPEKFLVKKYFLTQQQRDIRDSILQQLEIGEGDWQETIQKRRDIRSNIENADYNPKNKKTPKLFGITGGIGSGKTLLLYDIARSISVRESSCCIIDSGTLSPAHAYLNCNWDRVDIVDLHILKDNDPEQMLSADTIVHQLEAYDFILVDEIHRMEPSIVQRLLTAGVQKSVTFICTYVSQDWLSRAERYHNILTLLTEYPGFTEWILSKRIRTGVDNAAFYRNMLEMNAVPRGDMDYSSVDVIYATDQEEAQRVAAYYEDILHYTCPNQRRVDVKKETELEYDNVLIVVEGSLGYDGEGVLCDLAHPQSEMELDTQMYRYVTRTRKKLCILVIANYQLFLQIAGIKYRMMERVQYQTSILDAALSGKMLTKLTRAVKNSAEDMNEKDRQILIDSVDIITEELQSVGGNRKVIRNNIRFIKKILEENREKEAFAKAAEAYIEYVGYNLG